MPERLTIIPICLPKQGCVFYDPPPQLEYYIATPAVYNTTATDFNQITPDQCFLGIPGVMRWLPVNITPPGTGIFWRYVISDREKNAVAIGSPFQVGPFGFYNMRAIATTTDGGQTWTQIADEGDGQIVAPDRISRIFPLTNGDFAVATANGGIGTIPGTMDSFSLNYPGGVTPVEFFNYSAIQSVSGSRLIALAYEGDTSDNFALMSESLDSGATWSDWTGVGQSVDLGPNSYYVGQPRVCYPKNIFCLADRFLVLGFMCGLTSDFQTFQPIYPATVNDLYHGANYDQLNPDGTPIDDSTIQPPQPGFNSQGFDYWAWGPYEHFIISAMQTDQNTVITFDDAGEMIFFTDQGFSWSGYNDVLSWGNPKDFAYSRQHGLTVVGSQSEMSVSHDGVHWYQPRHPQGLQRIQGLAPVGTQDQAFFNSLLAVGA